MDVNQICIVGKSYVLEPENTLRIGMDLANVLAGALCEKRVTAIEHDHRHQNKQQKTRERVALAQALLLPKNSALSPSIGYKKGKITIDRLEYTQILGRETEAAQSIEQWLMVDPIIAFNLI